jgi:hypothetical protein
MIAMSIYGFVRGNTTALIAGVDSTGNICGFRPTTVENFPKTYYMMS